MSRVLVAGIGNIFLGDDAFGVEVVGRLRERTLPEAIEVADFGIRAFDLAYALQEDYSAAVLVDAAARGDAPGTIYVIEPDDGDSDDEAGVLSSGHEMTSTAVVQMARSMGRCCGRIVVVGCEPETFGTEDDGIGRIGLGASVAASIDRAVELVESVALHLLQDGNPVNGDAHDLPATGGNGGVTVGGKHEGLL